MEEKDEIVQFLLWKLPGHSRDFKSALYPRKKKGWRTNPAVFLKSIRASWGPRDCKSSEC